MSPYVGLFSKQSFFGSTFEEPSQNEGPESFRLRNFSCIISSWLIFNEVSHEVTGQRLNLLAEEPPKTQHVAEVFVLDH